MTVRVEVTADLAACHRLRRIVFIEEQGVSDADEHDGRDAEALHLLLLREGRPTGCARILFDGATAKIGRVCVLRQDRGHGLGKALVIAACDAARERGAQVAKLGAQVPALGFYEALGFVAYGPVFDDAGIDHRMMRRALDLGD